MLNINVDLHIGGGGGGVELTKYILTFYDENYAHFRYRFPSIVLTTQFHPRNSDQFLVCPMKHSAVLVSVSGKHSTLPLDTDSVSAGAEPNVCAIFDRRGAHIITGNSKGKVLVIRTEDLKVVASFRISASSSQGTLAFFSPPSPHISVIICCNE